MSLTGGRKTLKEWEHFTAISTSSDGKAVTMKCNFYDWKGSAHATRLKLHHAKFHKQPQEVRTSQSSVKSFLTSALPPAQQTAAEKALTLLQVKHSSTGKRRLRILPAFSYCCLRQSWEFTRNLRMRK